MKKIIKRDGTAVEFNQSKIEQAIRKAMSASSDANYAVICPVLAGEVEQKLDEIYGDDAPTVEQVQDEVIRTLIARNYADTVMKYVIYREKHRAARNVKSALDFCKGAIQGYTGEADDITEFLDGGASTLGHQNWHVKQNASVSYSIGGSILNNSEQIVKAHWLNDFYDDEIRELYESGAIHIHDLGFLAGYCAGWNLLTLIKEGLGGVPGKISSGPAKHLYSLCNQMVNFLGIMQNEWAGAQAFSSFDTYLAPYVKKDNLTYKEVRQAIQSFVYGVNIPSRWGTQAPFSNITLDWTCPEDMKNLPAIVGGEKMDFTYGDCKAEMDMVNKAFIEVMIAGDINGRGFSYPIPTYSITKDFDWSDTENNRLLFEMAAKYGTPYFSNYINSDMDPSDVRSMCCRLRLDLRELRRQNGGNFGAGENTGSIGVVTINVPRIAYLARDQKDFYQNLTRVMNVAARSLDIKRRVISKYMEMGLYPYTKRYLKDGFANHFSTIGLVGMNEACLNAAWIREDMTHEKAYKWTGAVLDFMREKLSDYQEQYGCLFNLEATPAESTAYRLSMHDKKLYPDIITAGTDEAPYYTNSSHLPVGATDDVFEALEIQDDLQTKYTSGTVFHCFLGERLSDWSQAAGLVKKVCENFRLPYFTLSPIYSVCEEHGYINGDSPVCPICGKPTEVYSRITGYYRPVKNWNIGKTQEYAERKSYEIEATDGLKSPSEVIPAKAEPDPVPEKAESAYLFTTKNCPKCKMLKSMGVLDVIGGLEEVDAEDDANRDLVEQYDVKCAPTLVLEEGDRYLKYDNPSAIIEYCNTKK